MKNERVKEEMNDDLLNIISETYKLINFSDQVEEPYRENVRQARKKLNVLAAIINKASIVSPTISSLLAEKENEIASLRRMINILKNIQLSQPPQQEKVKGIDWDSIETEFIESKDYEEVAKKKCDMLIPFINYLKQTYPTGIPSQQAGNRNWTEDFTHENGNYQNICIKCNHEFIGYKRRQVCKVCSTESKEAVEAKNPQNCSHDNKSKRHGWGNEPIIYCLDCNTQLD